VRDVIAATWRVVETSGYGGHPAQLDLGVAALRDGIDGCPLLIIAMHPGRHAQQIREIRSALERV
jgi:hypothetical protein